MFVVIVVVVDVDVVGLVGVAVRLLISDDGPVFGAAKGKDALVDVLYNLQLT